MGNSRVTLHKIILSLVQNVMSSYTSYVPPVNFHIQSDMRSLQLSGELTFHLGSKQEETIVSEKALKFLP